VRAGNPVLSIHQSDVIVYGGTLRGFLLADLRIAGAEPERDAPADVPFWGALIS
jgi:hypothetical protein